MITPHEFIEETHDVEETLKAPELFRNQKPHASFEAGLKALYQIPIHRSHYEVTRCLWDMWNSDPPEADTFWLLSVGPRLELTGIAVISERTRCNWSNYYSIDDAVSWGQTIDFQITAADIAFGPNKSPSFWGLHRHLKKVSSYLLKKNHFKNLCKTAC